MKPRERYDKMLLIQEHLAKLQTEDWLLKRLARKVLGYFTADPIGTIDTFIDHGWDPSDIYHWLNNSAIYKHNDPFWTDSFHHVFLVEKVLHEAGLSKEVAHSLVLTQAWMFTIPPVTLEFSMKTLVNLGYPEDVIKSIANQMPQLFHMLPEHILYECERATTSQRGLLWNSYLRRDAVEAKPEPPPTDPRTGRVRGNVRSKPAPKKVNNKPAPAPRVAKPLTIPLPRMEIPEQATETESDGPKKLKPLRTFNPLREDPVSKPTEPPPEEPEEGPTSIFPGALPMPALVTLPKEEPEDEKDLYSLIDLKKFQAIVEAANPRNADECWEKYLTANPWLQNFNSQEYRACVAILRWVPLNFFPTPQHLTDDSDASRRTRFWKALLLDKDIRALLTTPLMVLEIRFYALRRIGSKKDGRNFVKDPRWLLLEWENSSEPELRYRSNEIEARGKKAHLKPYINMLLEPEREKFLKRLNNFIERLDQRDDYYLELDDDGENIIMEDAEKPAVYITREELKAKLLARRKK
jgi:hypothetical protein